MKTFTRILAAGVGALAVSATANAQNLTPTQLSVIGAIGFHPQYRDYEEPFWTKTIKEKSGGSVSIAIKPWTEMGLKGPEVLRLVQRGTFQIGTVNLNYNAGDDAAVEAHDLPGLAPTIDDMRKVTAAWRGPFVEKMKKDFGVTPLAMFNYSAQVLYCRDKFEKLADIKGRKVRTSGAAQANFVKALGGSGINVAFGEVHQALDRGVVDCAITGAYSGYSAKWYEASKYISPIAVNWGAQTVIANNEAWNKIPEAVRNFLTKEIENFEKAVMDLAERESRTGILCNTTGPCETGAPGGMILVEVKPEDQETLQRVLREAVLPDFARRCGKACVEAWNGTVGKAVGLEASVN